MNMNFDLYEFLSEYIERIKKTYLTNKFGYTSYTKPNTMFQINNKLPEILMTLDLSTIKMYLKCLSLIKRNHDPTFCITITMTPESFSDIVSRGTYFKSKKILLDLKLIVKTPKPSIILVNPEYANKLFKPKFEDPFDDV